MKTILFTLSYLWFIRADDQEEDSKSALIGQDVKEELVDSNEADPFVSGLAENEQSGLIANSESNLASPDSGNGDSNLNTVEVNELAPSNDSKANENASNAVDSKDENNKENLNKEESKNNKQNLNKEESKLDNKKSNAPGSIESLSMAEKKELQTELFGMGKNSNKPVSKYWTEVLIDNKSKNVLVNIKTVTIIESISTVKPNANTASESKDSAFPYIKIQMPSSTTNKENASKSIANKSVENSKSIASKSISQSKSIASKSVANIKSVSSKSVANIKSSSEKMKTATAKPVTLTPINVKPTTVSSSKPSTSASPKTASEDPSSVGSIFNVLKNLPSGGKESASVYVEGTFKFPKKKEISNKLFKLSGYVSQA